MFLEGGYCGVLATPGRCNYYFQFAVQFDPANTWYSLIYPHNQRTNALFFDGHIESRAPADLDFHSAIADLNNP